MVVFFISLIMFGIIIFIVAFGSADDSHWRTLMFVGVLTIIWGMSGVYTQVSSVDTDPLYAPVTSIVHRLDGTSWVYSEEFNVYLPLNKLESLLSPHVITNKLQIEEVSRYYRNRTNSSYKVTIK